MAKSDLVQMVEEGHRAYRQSGLGLSATVISITYVVFVKVGFSVAQAPHITLAASTVALALSIQVCHYFGYKNQTRAHMSILLQKGSEKDKLWESATKGFDRADWSVKAVLVLFCLQILAVMAQHSGQLLSKFA